MANESCFKARGACLPATSTTETIPSLESEYPPGRNVILHRGQDKTCLIKPQNKLQNNKQVESQSPFPIMETR